MDDLAMADLSRAGGDCELPAEQGANAGFMHALTEEADKAARAREADAGTGGAGSKAADAKAPPVGPRGRGRRGRKGAHSACEAQGATWWCSTSESEASK